MTKYQTSKRTSTGKAKTLTRKLERYGKNLERLASDQAFTQILKRP